MSWAATGGLGEEVGAGGIGEGVRIGGGAGRVAVGTGIVVVGIAVAGAGTLAAIEAVIGTADGDKAGPVTDAPLISWDGVMVV